MSETVFSVASASTIMIATSPDSSTRPVTTMSKVACSICSSVGKHTHCSPMRTARVEPSGPEKGSPASWVDMEAPFMATTSYSSRSSTARMVPMTWTSLRRPLTKEGRRPRSIRRQVRIAFSLGRPSRRKNEPGMRPAAYIRSSMSTVSGKKSKWSFGFFEAAVVARTTVSSIWTMAEPCASLARRPVLKMISLVPNPPLSMTAVAWCSPRL